jgi:isoquinoline 1-oxidoreductase alpha subunit
MVTLNINGKRFDADVEPETPLLWVLRDTLGLTGTKFGCGAANLRRVHGSCPTAHRCAPARCVSGCSVIARSRRSKRSPSRRIIPLSPPGSRSRLPQCGYCQAGQIMTATALLASNPKPSDADIDREMVNICRCGTYTEIRAAIRKASDLMAKG